jgi:hypothetical protein
MQLSHSQTRSFVTAVLCAVAAAALSCHKTESRSIGVSLCEIYRNPAAYDGKLVTLTATITQLPNGKYLYPGSSRECSYSFNSLTQHESSTTPSNVRMEFDLEVTGTFDAKYSERWDAFKYRLFPTHIKALSPLDASGGSVFLKMLC